MDSGNRGVDLFLNMAQLIPTIVDKFFKDISPMQLFPYTKILMQPFMQQLQKENKQL